MPAIKRLFISNFKNLDGDRWIDLEDINLLIGPNNSGKSSLIKGFRLFSDSISKTIFPRIQQHEADESLGELKDLLNWNSKSDCIGLGFCFDYWLRGGDPAKKRIPELTVLFVKFYFRFDDDSKEILTSHISIGELLIKQNSFIEKEILRLKMSSFGKLYDDPLKQISFEHGDWLGNGEIEFSFDTSNLITLLKKYKGVFWRRRVLNFKSFIEYIKKNHPINWEGTLLETTIEKIWKTNINFVDIFKEFEEDSLLNFLPSNGREQWLEDLMKMNKKQRIKYENTIKLWKENNDYSIFLSFLRRFLLDCQIALESFYPDNCLFMKSTELYHERVIKHSSTTKYLNIISQESILSWQNSGSSESSFFSGTYSFIKDSLQIFGFSGEFEVRNYENDAFVIYLIENGRKINIADLGKGTAKIITLIFKIAAIFNETKFYRKQVSKNSDEYMPEFENGGKLIFIEEPESFLHPDWQSKLADFFKICFNQAYYKFQSGSESVKLIIETHSEYIIRKFQYLIARDNIKDIDSNFGPGRLRIKQKGFLLVGESENYYDQIIRLIIYYFDSQNSDGLDEFRIKKMQIRNDGMINEDFGPGFYDEAVKLTIDLLKLQKN